MNLKEKSEENWKMGAQLHCSSKFDAAANRIYYSIFQAAKFFAMAKTDVKDEDQIGHYEVENNITSYTNDPNSYQVYGKMKKLRTIADYRPYSVCESRFTREFLNEVDSLRKKLIDAAI